MTKPRFFVSRIGRQFPGTRDYLDLRVFANNYVGFALVLFGFGLRVRIRIRVAKLPDAGDVE